MKRWGYRSKLFLSCALLFAAFTAGIALFEHSRERTWRTEALEQQMEMYAELIHAGGTFRPADSTSLSRMKERLKVLPSGLRVSLIDEKGNVYFDTSIDEWSALRNHTDRPEIRKAQKEGSGSNIRRSSSTGKEYLYYAKRFDDGYVRVAQPYDIETADFLQADNLFLYFVIVLFALTLLLMNYVLRRFSRSIRQLRELALHPESAQHTAYHFPKDELGDISEKITEQFRLLQKSEATIAREREKLLQHIHTSGEGLCFFSADRSVEFINGLFIRHLNLLTDEPDSNPSVIWDDPQFAPLHDFMTKEEEGYFEMQIEKHGRIFALHANVFADKSCEVVLDDITRQEKTKTLKQEMTSNIAHELRTPVTSIRGYLETILEQTQLDENARQYFLTRAYEQTIVLSDLIRDISLITRMEGAASAYTMERTDIGELAEMLHNDFLIALSQNRMTFDTEIPTGTIVTGNKNLLHALLRNLLENAIRYAGEGTKVVFKYLHDDDTHVHFSFYDTGLGIADEKHLLRLFERFYRVSEGRTRDKGGSGLGLSIVKNAVLLHRGDISVRNRKEGGLEFLFSLAKSDGAVPA